MIFVIKSQLLCKYVHTCVFDSFLYQLIVFYSFYRYSCIFGALSNKNQRLSFKNANSTNSSKNKAQNKDDKIIILVSIHSLLDRALNKLSNASNRAEFGVTVLELWRKQNLIFSRLR